MAGQGEKSVKEARPRGPELRLIDRRAFVGFPELEVAPGLSIVDFALQIPDVTFPFSITGGASKYQRRKLDFGYLELWVEAELISREVSRLAGKLSELDDLKLHFRPGYLEAQARLRNGDRPAATFKVAFDGDGERLAVYLYDVRLYAFSVTAAPQVPALVSRSLQELGLLPEVELKGASGFTTRLLPPLVQLAAVGRGYKMPGLDQARLSTAEVSSKGLRLRFSSGGLPPAAPPDEELLLALEGARAFADAEELVAAGQLREAREAYLRLGDVQEAHPFAAERLLALLVADPQAHELALDVAASLARRRERSATALWAEAVVRERRGESARAAERYLALCGLSRKNQEQAAAFFAAESAARASRDQAPQMAVRALHEVLGLKPDHLPSLKALARASDQANDRAGAIRAYRRIAALARDPAEAAEAHVQLARLCALTEDDFAGARLHCEAALRLAPDHPEALYRLAELCHQAGEHLRAVKALDRLREVALGRHEVDRIGRANLLAGLIWEQGLAQPENALLRYREAASLLPGEPEPLYRAARVADGLGRIQEALASYQQAIELAGPAPRSDEIRQAAHQSRHALARLAKKLGDPARAREHLEAALELNPSDMAAIEELLPFFRATGKAPELAEALEKAAQVTEEPSRRAVYWAEAGELYRGRLSNQEKAERFLASALEADPKNRLALEGMLALAESRRDGGQLCRCLRALAELAEDGREKVRYYRRLAVAARDLTFDLELAAQSLGEVLKVEPDDLPALGELCGLQRRRSDMAGLASALEQRARAAEAASDPRLASAALRELAQVLEARLGRAGEALVALEKAARLAPDASVLLELGNLSLRCERPEPARRALEDLLATLPGHAAPERIAEVRGKLGRACELLGDKDAARENYAAAFPLRRLDDELSGRLESLYQEGGRTKELTEMWAARAQALSTAGRPQDAAALFFRSAQALLKEGDAAGALLRLHAALDAAPEGERTGEILETMAELELGRGQKLEAARLYARRAGLFSNPRAAARMLFQSAGLARATEREAPFLAEALEKDPSFAPARLRRAELALESDSRAAMADLEAVLATDLADPDAPAEAERTELIRQAGFAALRAGYTDTARAHLALYSAQCPQDLGVRKQLAHLHRRAGAKEALCDLLGELWPSLTGPEQGAARKELVELSLELGRTVAAKDGLRGILTDQPADPWAANRLLQLLPSEGATPAEQSERLGLLGALIEAAGGDTRAELLAQRARLLWKMERLPEARADLTDAAREASTPAPLLVELAKACQEAGDEAGELSAWQQAVEKDLSLLETASARMLSLSRRRLSARDFAGARAGFEAAARLSLPPSDRCEAYFGLAEAARSAGDSEGAGQALLEASRLGPAKRRVEALLLRGELLEGLEQHAEAVESYESALSLAPGHQAATAGLKRALPRVEDWEGLAEVLAAEAAHAPKEKAAPLLAELGTLYLDRLGLKGPAEAALKRAALLDRQNPEIRQRLAGLLFERGELRGACQLLEEAAEALPPGEAAQLLQSGIDRAREASELELAVRLARSAHARSPASGARLSELADLLYLHGAIREALPLQQALASAVSFEDAPDLAEGTLLRLADLAEQCGERVVAEQTLRRLTSHRPLCAAAVERLAALVHEKSPRDSIELLATHALSLSPSERTARSLVSLAERARAELSDIELSARLLGRAVEMSERPLELRRSLASLYRDSGRAPELMAVLLEIADQELAAGEVERAISAYQEEARLAEECGRIDEAIRTLTAMVELLVDEGEPARAAELERRRAEMLRDAKLDLEGAEAALRRAFELEPELETARAAIALARRRDDREGEVDWIERTLELTSDPRARAQVFVQLAKLQLGLAPEQAEAALREALRHSSELAEAEQLLLALYQQQDRQADVAGYYEEKALRTSEPGERARLLIQAAQIYKDRAGRPHAAAAALLAARGANPDDLSLTAQAAELLHEVGLSQDAAELEGLLLEADPFHPCFERHLAFLREAQDHQAVAALHLRRAQRQTGPQAASGYLEAASAFREMGAAEQALLCESQAFEADPADARAFLALRKRAGRDVRKLSALLQDRARAMPEQAVELYKERAELLFAAGESLLAAEALDDLLQVAPDDEQALASRAELAAQAGGPSAAQPYDQRLLSLAGERMPLSLKLKLKLRLGHAALDSNAWKDAADCFQAVVELDPEGERGQEALFLLSEVHARTQNAPGLFQTSLLLARKARPDEAEALYRRAAALFDAPQEALEALLPLARMRPADSEVVERAESGLWAAGRHQELVELLEESAEASGGSRGAELLLRAAQVLEEALGDATGAAELRARAALADPENPAALRALAEEQRRSGDALGLSSTLERLTRSAQGDEASLLWLELGQLRASLGDPTGARSALERVLEVGPSGAGHAAALAAMETLLTQAGDDAALSRVLAARAALAEGEAAGELLLLAGQAARRAGEASAAAAWVRQALALRPSLEGFLQLAALEEQLGEKEQAARDLVEAAALSPAEAAGPLLLRASELCQPWGAGERAKAVWRALFEQRRDQGQLEQAIQALGQLISMEAEPRARAALRAELGELYAGQGELEQAKQLFESALAEDQEAVGTVRRLLSLYHPTQEASHFAAMAERLERLAGAEALEGRKEELFEAYLTLRRRPDAYRLLGELPESLERLATRAQLSGELGLAAESLALRERLADGPEQLERVLWGYLEAELLPAAVRVGTVLAEAAGLLPCTQRYLAEQLSPKSEGAALATRLWPALLRQQLLDADGWTLFAEALRNSGRAAEAQLADGFGAALTSSGAVVSSVIMSPLGRPEGSCAPAPEGLTPVNELSMPRLFGVVSGALSELGAPGMQVALDPRGGPEAYLAGEDMLVLGAGALSCFGGAELDFLCALAVALGNRGALLTRPGRVDGLEQAAVEAFQACPSSLPAARVLVHLDDRARGRDPSQVTLHELLPGSPSFQAVALRALEMIGG